MKGLIVSLYATTASFRDPNTHLYQETVLAPPPTTIVGIAGAALGKGFEDAMDYFKKNLISVGCIIHNKGIGKDLWNYTKIKTNEVGKDILIREFLYDVELNIFMSSQDSNIIEELYQAFNNPFYALTLGNSDELAKISNIEICDEVDITESKDIKNTWICGNYINNFELDWKKVKSSIKMSIRPPIIKNLPIEFVFNDNDEREAVKFSKFTFLGEAHLLKESIEVCLFNDNKVPMYGFSEK